MGNIIDCGKPEPVEEDEDGEDELDGARRLVEHKAVIDSATENLGLAEQDKDDVGKLAKNSVSGDKCVRYVDFLDDRTKVWVWRTGEVIQEMMSEGRGHSRLHLRLLTADMQSSLGEVVAHRRQVKEFNNRATILPEYDIGHHYDVLGMFRDKMDRQRQEWRKCEVSKKVALQACDSPSNTSSSGVEIPFFGFNQINSC